MSTALAKKTLSSSANNGQENQNRVSVYVRVRPHIARIDGSVDDSSTKNNSNANKDDEPLICCKTTKAGAKDENNNDNDKKNDVERKIYTPQKTFGNFTQCFGPSSSNRQVYEASAIPRAIAETVVGRGGAACCFAFGVTGSGKTHTLLGYDKEDQGLYELAGADLLRQLQQPSQKLELQFFEIYNDTLHDLLSLSKEQQEDNNGGATTTREPFFVRTDADGSIQIRGRAEVAEDGKVYYKQLTRQVVTTLNELRSVVTEGIASRACGSSNLHSQSSRSHACMTMQVVTDELLLARKQQDEARAAMIPVAAAMDTLVMEMAICDLTSRPMKKVLLRPEEEEEEENKGQAQQQQQQQQQQQPQIVPLTPVEQHRVEQQMQALQQVQDPLEAATRHVQKLLLGRDAAAAGGGGTPQEAEEEEEGRRRQVMVVGGTLTFCDLAGAEKGSDKTRLLTQTLAEQKEARQINSSLLALHQVLRALNQSSSLSSTKKRPPHIPFRNSKLTMILKPYLWLPPQQEGQEEEEEEEESSSSSSSSSLKRPQQQASLSSVMVIATVSGAAEQFDMNLRTLTHANLLVSD